MATLTANSPSHTYPTDVSTETLSSVRFVVPLGRFLYCFNFILSGLSHFSSQTVAYAQSRGVPMASFLVPVAGAMAILGGLMILFGWKARWGALLLILFLIPVTLTMHNFWAIPDVQMAQIQKINFLKNLGLLGAAFCFFYFGAGPFSVDERAKEKSNL